MLLSNAQLNKKLNITELPSDKKTTERLKTLGIDVNCKISVVKRSALSKCLLIEVGFARFILRKSLANKIGVEYA